MNIVSIHARMRHEGGEDRVAEAEAAVLESKGHTVVRIRDDNRRVDALGKLELVRATFWNPAAAAAVAEAVRNSRAQVAHFHNTFPLLSPACYEAARNEGAAVVQTLHNFRLLCPGATFSRDGAACQACLGRTFAWPGVLHGCYRSSRAATATVAAMTAAHRWRGTWERDVDLYLALSARSRELFVRGGMAQAKILVKTNFLAADPGCPAGSRDGALFTGRLSQEKGVGLLLDAWRPAAGRTLRLIGDGPEQARLAARPVEGIEWLGWRQPQEIAQHLSGAAFALVPSSATENCPMVILEAFAAGTPVIGAATGGIPELVTHGETGLLFPVGDAHALRNAIDWAFTHPEEMRQMGRAARLAFESKYGPDQGYANLMTAYETAIRLARAA